MNGVTTGCYALAAAAIALLTVTDVVMRYFFNNAIFGAAEDMAKRVSQGTGGKFQISVAGGGELMPAFGVVDGVQSATVEMAHTAPYYFFGKDPTFALGCAIPFGLNARQIHLCHVAASLDGKGRSNACALPCNGAAGHVAGCRMGHTVAPDRPPRDQ